MKNFKRTFEVIFCWKLRTLRLDFLECSYKKTECDCQVNTNYRAETDGTRISGLIPILILWLPLNRYRDWYRDSEEPPIDTGTDTDTQRSPQSIPILILIPGPQSILILIPILLLHKVFHFPWKSVKFWINFPKKLRKPPNRYRDWYRDSEKLPIDTGTDTDTEKSPQSIPIPILSVSVSDFLIRYRYSRLSLTVLTHDTTAYQTHKKVYNVIPPIFLMPIYG